MNDTFMKEKPIFPLLVSMALPMVISMLVNALYNIVDSLFVAQISEDAMTALSLVYPVQNLINAIAIGFGVGINAQIALHLGAGEHKKANTAATHGLMLSLLHGVVITVVSILIMPTFLRMFTSDETVIRMGVTYSRIAFLFSTVIMATLAFEKIFQAVGRMRVTMVGLMAGSVCNIILDPMLIFGIGPFPKMGIAGAALATGIGQILTLTIYLFVYNTTEISVRVRRDCMTPNRKMDVSLYAIGIPAILNLALPSLLVSFLNSILAAYSQVYVVVLGIYYKLQTFLYLPANGIVQGMRPIIGYNYGAGEDARVKRIYNLTLAMTGTIMAGGTVLCLVFAGPLMNVFSSNPETIAAGQTALRIICAGFIVSSLTVTGSGALEGLGKGTESLIISLVRYIIAMMPIAWVLCRLLGPTGVWHAFWITEAITAGISVLVYRKAVKRPQ
ncbi:MATE family efflux transporter [uncultured Gemmiger sp.]|uniref:MATE family efflux transporter n=1 Tax=uncultured Gemmiger sp. TaxID=1623490 RepID=UPI00262CE5F9|nr:MATE family efflux transporter [uncultured Gemmiger sp.]